jgi:CMP-2-keto-3-deoxyoctulosonic acid synthetase
MFRLPHKTDLDLGKRLALRFAASELPYCRDRIADFFRHKGAYARFKDLLDSEGALERWYKYETEATERALRTGVRRTASNSSGASAMQLPNPSMHQTGDL